MKKYLWILIIIMISGCSQCNFTERIIIENGNLPDSALLIVPYQNGKVYKLKHSAGLVINFTANRETTDEITNCVEYCKYETHYQTNRTTLYPDYPIFNISFEINNLDTNQIFCSALIAKSAFVIPDSKNNVEKVDSVLVDTTYYKEVFKIKSQHYTYYNDSIYVDSMYYNYESGILKLIMSNNETYTICK